MLRVIYDLRPARSVVDFGCGLGNWLRAARELGSTVIHGYDTPGIAPAARGLANGEFTAIDFAERVPVTRRYELAVCLEMAHRLAPSSAAALLESLCSAADWVLFSAAPPFQGGAGNVSECWKEAWARSFAGAGFRCYDILRPMIWNDENIPFYLRQNICLYVRRGADAPLVSRGIDPTDLPASVIHPELFLKYMTWLAADRGAATDSRAFERELAQLYDAQDRPPLASEYNGACVPAGGK